VRLFIGEYFDGDDSASGNPRIAIDLHPFAEILVATIEKALDVLHCDFL
jgi:hypothetical protein